MHQTKAPQSTPSPISGGMKLNKSVGSSDHQKVVFINLALDMSWRLALIVLVPIVGGYELDKKLKTVPIITVLGLVVALVGTILVIKRSLRLVNADPDLNPKGRS